MAPPKLFVSYSWSDRDHEQWVLQLATHLRESGVDVVLDKWDLKEGHDAVSFMEKMVTDKDIKKVLMVCDETYSAKADGREGGVGTETQIISREVYEKQDQEKFVAVVCARDADGKPFLPTYYRSRIFIDLSEADSYSENFERLLRWIFDKPLYSKPELGRKPAFLEGGDESSLGTGTVFRRCLDAIRGQKSHAEGALREYLSLFAQNLERFRLVGSEGPFDDAVLSSIESLRPYRNEVTQIVTAIAANHPTDEYGRLLHRFFESLIPYMNRPAKLSQWDEWDFDNFRFVIHELFLYSLAIMIKHERIGLANCLLEQQYYVPENADYGRNVMMDFTVLREHMVSLESRNHRLELRRLSVRADLLKNRTGETGIEFRDLMQADFIAFMRAEISGGDYTNWWPETLVYVGDFHAAFEIFARSSSTSYFDQIKVILGVESKDDLAGVIDEFRMRKRKVPTWQHRSFSPSALLGFEKIASRP